VKERRGECCYAREVRKKQTRKMKEKRKVIKNKKRKE